MIWLKLQFELSNIAESAKSSLSDHDSSEEKSYSACKWLKDNIYCTGERNEEMKNFFDERVPSCKSQVKC